MTFSCSFREFELGVVGDGSGEEDSLNAIGFSNSHNGSSFFRDGVSRSRRERIG